MGETLATKECDRICEVCGFRAPLRRGDAIYCLLCGDLLSYKDISNAKKYSCGKCGWAYIDRPISAGKSINKKRQSTLDDFGA